MSRESCYSDTLISVLESFDHITADDDVAEDARISAGDKYNSDCCPCDWLPGLSAISVNDFDVFSSDFFQPPIIQPPIT